MNAADRIWLQRIEDKQGQLLADFQAFRDLIAQALGQPPDFFGTVDGNTGEILPPTPTGRRKRATEVDDAFRDAMAAEFSGTLGIRELVDQIKLALAHKASTKYHDKQTYVHNWLKRAVEYRKHHQGSPEGLEAKREADQERYYADYKRRWGEDEVTGDETDQG